MTPDDFDSDFERQRAKRVDLARKALLEYLSEHPDESMQDMFDHFFPPSPLPFSREDLRTAFFEELYTQRVDLSLDYKLRRNDIPVEQS